MQRTPSDAIPGRNRYDESARDERVAWWREKTGVNPSSVAPHGLAADELRGRIENFVGAVAIPLGLAGPLAFTGGEAAGSWVAPMATTEGALVAATSRGALALTQAGGVRARVHSRQMVRAPLFAFRDGGAAARFVEWLKGQSGALAEQARSGSRHTELVEVRPFVIGRDVHVVLSFHTGDAAGQNMTTLATARIGAWIERALPGGLAEELELFTVEGQMSGDKNLSAFNATHGRGARVSAECFLPRAVLEGTLNVSPERVARAHHAATAGALQAGVVGYNANVANVIAALYVATGQDIACVHESSFAILTLDARADGAYANLLLPSLIVGTVGGGTGLPGPHACLQSLGCAGAGKVGRFAEIIAGFALALELSAYAAMVSGEFAAAHASLGRRPREPT